MNRFAELLILSGAKQTSIARACNVSQPTISAWKSGAKKMTLENAIAAAQALGVTVGCLVGTEPIPEGYGSTQIPAINETEMKKAPAERQGQAAPFSQEQLQYLDGWKKDLAREVADLIQEGTSSSSAELGA